MPKDPTTRNDIIIWPDWTPRPISSCCSVTFVYNPENWEGNEEYWETSEDYWEQ